MRQCSKCKEVKNYSKFCKNKKAKIGIYFTCKKCFNEAVKKYRKSDKYKEYKQKNSERIKKYFRQYFRKYRKTNKSKIYCKKYGRKYRKTNKRIEYHKEYAQRNKDRIKKYSAEYRNRNKEYYQKWRKENKGKNKKYFREYAKEQRKNPRFRLDQNISRKIRYSLIAKKAGRKWETLVGYTLQDLIIHIEKQFDDKMSWQNYGSYWHIDHIVPKSWFPYETAEEQAFKNCWGLANLQPLEAKENWSKNNKWISKIPIS